MIILKNKKVNFNYEIVKKYTAGMVLFGFEVKALKNKKASFEASFISFDSFKKELFLKNFYIAPYQENNTPEWYDERRERKLLLRKSEILEIEKEMKASRLTMAPLEIFINEKKILKLNFALVRGKKKHDKRESLKKRDDLRNIEREVKNLR